MVTEKTKEHYTLNDWEKTWMNTGNQSLFISANHKENREEFKKKVFEEAKKIHIQRFPYSAFLYQEYEEE